MSSFDIKGSYFDGGFRQIQGSRQFTPPRPGHVVLPVELLLQPGDLLPGERSPVPADLVCSVGQVGALTRDCFTRVGSGVTRVARRTLVSA